MQSLKDDTKVLSPETMPLLHGLSAGEAINLQALCFTLTVQPACNVTCRGEPRFVSAVWSGCQRAHITERAICQVFTAGAHYLHDVVHCSQRLGPIVCVHCSQRLEAIDHSQRLRELSDAVHCS